MAGLKRPATLPDRTVGPRLSPHRRAGPRHRVSCRRRLRWWDRWLRGEENGIDTEPMVCACGSRIMPVLPRAIAERTWALADAGRSGLDVRHRLANCRCRSAHGVAWCVASERRAQRSTRRLSLGTADRRMEPSWYRTGTADSINAPDDALSVCFDGEIPRSKATWSIVGTAEVCRRARQPPTSLSRRSSRACVRVGAGRRESTLLTWGALEPDPSRNGHAEPDTA